MTVPDLAAISLRAQSLAGRFRLPLSRRNWRGAAGGFQGQDVGSSLDFQDHRSYTPGDDPRHINWQAYARTGHYSMKLYREEVRPLIDLVLDASSSMFAFPDKEVRSLELSYFLAEMALSSGASVRLHLLRGAQAHVLQPEALRSHEWLDRARALPEEGAGVWPLGRVPFRSHSMRLLVSDLLFPGDAAVLLQPLAAHHGFGAIFAPYCPAESAPVWSGNYEMLDPESGDRSARRIDERLLARYREAYGQHFALWKLSAGKAGFSMARIDAGLPLAESLQAEAVRQQILELAP